MDIRVLIVCCVTLVILGLSTIWSKPFTSKEECAMKNYQAKQEELLKKIKAEIVETAGMTGVSKLSLQLENALKTVPRHLFVCEGEEEYAYLNSALPIGEGQTISQPYIVALMTELLDLKPTDKVLEIGTGSGYQAAILAQLALEVFTVEIFPSLSRKAQNRFKKLNYRNIHTLVGNGAEGWIEHAPYNKIIATAVADKLPTALINQLAFNGIMVIPLKENGDEQFLTVIHKDSKGNLSQKAVLSVRFVPFTFTDKR